MIAIPFTLNDSSVLDQWDRGLVQDILNDLNVEWLEEPSKLPKQDRAIVLLPARHHADKLAEINEQIANINKVILFLLGDEEASFPVEQIEHPNIEIWIQNPHIGKHDNYHKLGTGYPQHLKQEIGEQKTKDIDIFFAGQVTHQRRQELIRVLSDMLKYSVAMYPSKSFTAGLEPSDYYGFMKRAKISPAPSGAVIPDSFRLFEALECMSLVIADQKTADGEIMQYWDWLFGEETPFPKVDDWDRLFSLVPELLKDYTANMHRQTAWYLQYKRNLKWKLTEQYYG